LSNNIIRDYNFIGEENLPRIDRQNILAVGNFDEPELPVFRVENHNARHSSKQSLDTRFENAQSLNHDSKTAHNHPGKAKHTAAPEKSPLEKLTEEYEQRLKKENQEAFLRGLSEGRNQGIAEWTPQSQRIGQALEKAMAALSQRNESNIQALEKSIGDLSMFLAEKIVGEAISRIPEVVKENLNKCLKLLAGSGKVTIKINPSDYEVIKAYIPSLLNRNEGKFSFNLEPAQNISQGGCFVELDGSMVDGRIETQLENIRQHIQILS
jgi:flagellar assembly protein FliH